MEQQLATTLKSGGAGGERKEKVAKNQHYKLMTNTPPQYVRMQVHAVSFYLRNLFRHLSDSDVFFWRRAPKLHARQLLEQHTLAQDKKGSKARPQASRNSKECLTPTPVVKNRLQMWRASETLLSKSRSLPEPLV